MKNALIIFVRNPVLGKVKTRIAEAIGDDEALRIYKILLQHTHDIALPVAADKYVFYSDHLQLNDVWEEDTFYKYLQAGKTLGDKMKDAFRRMFEKGYQNVLIIGSDCYELSTSILEAGFEALQDHEAVIGPARDGGYYLLAAKRFLPEVFENKKWSTASVAADTIADLETTGVSYTVLPVLNDVDTVADVPGNLLTP